MYVCVRVWACMYNVDVLRARAEAVGVVGVVCVGGEDGGGRRTEEGGGGDGVLDGVCVHDHATVIAVAELIRLGRGSHHCA